MVTAYPEFSSHKVGGSAEWSSARERLLGAGLDMPVVDALGGSKTVSFRCGQRQLAALLAAGVSITFDPWVDVGHPYLPYDSGMRTRIAMQVESSDDLEFDAGITRESIRLRKDAVRGGVWCAVWKFFKI